MHTRLWTRNFTLLTFSNFLMCSAYYSLISTLPVYISSELHAAKSIVGLVMASYLVSSVIIRPFCGYSLDRFGRKTIFIAGLILYALVFNTYLLAWTIPAMILVRFTHGLTWGVTTTSNSTVAIDIIPFEKRGQGIGYFGISTTLGMVMGPVIGSYVFQFGGYSTMFLAGFGLGLISALLAAFVKYPRFSPSQLSQPFGMKQLFETKIHPALPEPVHHHDHLWWTALLHCSLWKRDRDPPCSRFLPGLCHRNYFGPLFFRKGI